jgi:peroxiredoxin
MSPTSTSSALAHATIVDGDRVSDIHATAAGDTVLLSPDDLTAAIGWTLKPEGLCRADVCVPVRDRASLEVEGGISLRGVAELLGRPLALEVDPIVAVLGAAPSDVGAALATGKAPNFSLPDVDGGTVELDDYAGRKRMISTWSSWCGCRWDLPKWQQLYEQFDPEEFVILSVALDEDAEAVRHWARDEPTDPLTYPVLVDREHRVAELYGVTNVPTTIWIDEDGQIVRPPLIAPADNEFQDFTHIDAAVHNDALVAWVRDGVTPLTDDAVQERLDTPTADEQLARAERRLAMHLLRSGHDDAAHRHLERALELAPEDWTIHRGSMPVRGMDPFGQDFFDYWKAWEARGRPGYESA